VPYFHFAGSNAPWLDAPAGPFCFAPLSFPAGAASGKLRLAGIGIVRVRIGVAASVVPAARLRRLLGLCAQRHGEGVSRCD
jgi:hypothetical protein